MVFIVEILAFVLVAVLGWMYYLMQVNKKQREALKRRSKKLSEEEKKIREIKLKAFKYAKKHTSTDGKYFIEIYNAILDELLKEEEIKKNLLG